MPVVESLTIYPIKGCGSVSLGEAEVTPRGLMSGAIGDRRWMLIDEKKAFLTQREVPELARMTLKLTEDAHGIRVHADSQKSLDLNPGDITQERIESAVHGNPVTGHAVGHAADQWFSACLKRPVRLIYQAETDIRFSSEHFSPRPGVDTVGYADGFPILVTNRATLDRLNTRMEAPMPMNRFRPNIVIRDAEPEAEYGWRQIAIGGTMLALVKPCTRCVVTTVDQITGLKTGKEPLASLAKHYFLSQDFNGKQVQGAVFGENAVPVVCGSVAAGTPVGIAEVKQSYAFRKLG